jgi:hypothetical protein
MLSGRLILNIPTFFSIFVFPPIPLSLMLGNLYFLAGLMQFKRLTCAIETDPHESSLALVVVRVVPLRSNISCTLAWHIDLLPGLIFSKSNISSSSAAIRSSDRNMSPLHPPLPFPWDMPRVTLPLGSLSSH